MSGHIYKLYKTLSEQQMSCMNVLTGPCQGRYFFSEEERQMDLQAAGGSLDNEYTVENTDSWDPQKYACVIKQSMQVDTEGLRGLFYGTEKIAIRDSKLGIAALWHCDKTCISGCETLRTEISIEALEKEEHVSVVFEKKFGAGQLSGTLAVRYVLYLKEASMKEEAGIAGIPGTRLGEITKPLIIRIDGEGSSFPITNVTAKDKPLWWIDSDNITDPAREAFDEEYISLVLNEAHSDFSRLGQKNEYNTPLFYEVMASAMEEIFRRLYTDFREEMENEENRTEGSIAAAVAYMKECFHIEQDTPGHLHDSVRKMVRKQLRGGVPS